MDTEKKKKSDEEALAYYINEWENGLGTIICGVAQATDLSVSDVLSFFSWLEAWKGAEAKARYYKKAEETLKHQQQIAEAAEKVMKHAVKEIDEEEKWAS